MPARFSLSRWAVITTIGSVPSVPAVVAESAVAAMVGASGLSAARSTGAASSKVTATASVIGIIGYDIDLNLWKPNEAHTVQPVRRRQLPEPAANGGRTGSDQGWTAGVVEAGARPARLCRGERRDDSADRGRRTGALRQLGWAGPAIGMHAQQALQVRLGATGALVLMNMRRLRPAPAEQREHRDQRDEPGQGPASQCVQWSGDLHAYGPGGSLRDPTRAPSIAHFHADQDQGRSGPRVA